MLRTLAVAALLLSPLPAVAQNEVPYTSDDADALSACVDDAAKSLDDGDGGAAYQACIGVASNACQEEPDGASTVGISACNLREASWWDERLNDEYASLKQSLDGDTFAMLQGAQRSWIAYRDADCAFVDAVYKDGSIHQIYYSYCQLEHTATRVIELWLSVQN